MITDFFKALVSESKKLFFAFIFGRIWYNLKCSVINLFQDQIGISPELSHFYKRWCLRNQGAGGEGKPVRQKCVNMLCFMFSHLWVLS